MQVNGTRKPNRTIWRDLTDVIADHARLIRLEMAYEASLAGRRLILGIVALILGITAFMLLQVAIVVGLANFGISIPVASLLLSVVYGVLVVGLLRMFGRRHRDAGPPFEATQREIEESYRWIQKILS